MLENRLDICNTQWTIDRNKTKTSKFLEQTRIFTIDLTVDKVQLLRKNVELREIKLCKNQTEFYFLLNGWSDNQEESELKARLPVN